MASSTNTPFPTTNESYGKSISFIFYQAVRDLKPVWMLEDMRTMETFYQEYDATGTNRTFSPSEALLYAIVHDHQSYAQYLLSRYGDEAFARPGQRFCRCPSSVVHLATSVRYDRRFILGLILKEVHRLPSTPRYVNNGWCCHVEDGKTPLHLACKLLRPEAVIMLLGNGASTEAQDNHGMTPLDVILEQFMDHKAKTNDRKQCLDNLLMFMSRMNFKMKNALDKDPECWSNVLGEEMFKYLVGKSPAPLVLLAMQKIMRQLSPAKFPQSLHELPIPSSLKPLGLPSI